MKELGIIGNKIGNARFIILDKDGHKFRGMYEPRAKHPMEFPLGKLIFFERHENHDTITFQYLFKEEIEHMTKKQKQIAEKLNQIYEEYKKK